MLNSQVYTVIIRVNYEYNIPNNILFLYCNLILTGFKLILGIGYHLI